MAVTITASVVKRSVWGDQRAVIADLTSTGTYVTGGTAVAASLVGLKVIDHVIAPPMQFAADRTVGEIPVWDAENSKIVLYESGADTTDFPELSSGGTLLGVDPARYIFIGH